MIIWSFDTTTSIPLLYLKRTSALLSSLWESLVPLPLLTAGWGDVTFPPSSSSPEESLYWIILLCWGSAYTGRELALLRSVYFRFYFELSQSVGFLFYFERCSPPVCHVFVSCLCFPSSVIIWFCSPGVFYYAQFLLYSVSIIFCFYYILFYLLVSVLLCCTVGGASDLRFKFVHI